MPPEKRVLRPRPAPPGAVAAPHRHLDNDAFSQCVDTTANAPPLGRRRPRVGSLFSGCGGLDLGAVQAGGNVVFQCELSEHARAVLKARFKQRKRFKDITKLKRLPQCDILIAGPPCQDVSAAGRRAGLDGPQSGLITHMFDLLADARRRGTLPRYVVIEQVPAILDRQKGKKVPDIATIVRKLQAVGFASWAHRIVDVAAFGIPHRRRRVFLVASRCADAPDILLAPGRDGCPGSCPAHAPCYECVKKWSVKHTTPRGASCVVPTPASSIIIDGGNARSPPTRLFCPTIKTGNTLMVAMLAPSRPGGGRRVGKLTPEHAEALMGMQAGWTAPAGDLRPRWKLVGNAVAVCVAKWVVGRVIQRGWKQRAEPRFEPDRRDTLFTADAVVDTPRGTWPRCAWGVRQGRGFVWFASAASEAPVVTPLARLERFIKGDLRPVDAGWARRLVARMKDQGTDTAVVVEAARAFDVDVEVKDEPASPVARTTSTRRRRPRPTVPRRDQPPPPLRGASRVARKRAAGDADMAGASNKRRRRALARGAVGDVSAAGTQSGAAARAAQGDGGRRRERVCLGARPAPSTAVIRRAPPIFEQAVAARTSPPRRLAQPDTAPAPVATAAAAIQAHPPLDPNLPTLPAHLLVRPTPPVDVSGSRHGGWCAGARLDTVVDALKILVRHGLAWHQHKRLRVLLGGGLQTENRNAGFKRVFCSAFGTWAAGTADGVAADNMRYVLAALEEEEHQFVVRALWRYMHGVRGQR